LIHLLPFYLTFLVATVLTAWRRRWLPGPVLTVGLAGLMLLGVGGMLYRARQNTYGNMYAPAVEFLRTHASRDQKIFANASFCFGLDFAPNHYVDVDLGWRSGIAPDVVVVEPEYATDLERIRAKRPELWRYINTLLSDQMRLVYNAGSIAIYARVPRS
jgi:hypothetical protein